MGLLFREHRGSLEESMKTIRKIKSIDELGDVTVEDYGYDERLDSETKIVLKDGRPIGFITEEKKNQK